MAIIFKNKESEECLTMGKFGMNLNNQEVILDDCSDYTLKQHNFLDQTEYGYYQIKRGNRCLMPSSEKTDKNKTKVFFDISNCENEASHFKLYNEDMDTTEMTNEITDSIDVYILYGDNNSSNIGSDTNNQDKFMSYPGHIPHSNANPNYTIMYYTLYNMTGVSINDLLYSSTDIQCNIKYVVEEYDNDQNPLPFKTYYLIPSISFLNNQNQGGLFFSETENTEYKLTIKTTVDSTYTNNNQGRYNTQRINNNIITLGIYRNNRFYYAQINTNVYGNGLSLTTGNSSRLKLILKRMIDQYKFLYQYNRNTNSNNKVSLSSYVNPRKKIGCINNTTLKTFNTHDHTRRGKFLFSITPIGTGNYSGTVQELNVGGETINLQIYIQEVFNTITENPSSFDEIISQLNDLIKNIETTQIGNERYHSLETLSNFKSFRGLIIKLQICYDLLKSMLDQMINIISNLTVWNLFNGSKTFNATEFNYNSFNKNINNIDDLIDSLNKFVIYMNENKEINAPDITFQDITVDTKYLNHIAKLFNYFNLNKININEYVNNFYDYLNAKENSNFFLTDKSYLNIITPSTNNLPQRANNGVNTIIKQELFFNGFQYKQSPKTFIDLDFGIMYNYIYKLINNIPDALSVDVNHVMKIVDSSIDDISVDAENNLSFINYYYKWILTQQNYIEQYNKFIDLIQLSYSIENYITYSDDFKTILLNYYDNKCQPFLDKLKEYFPGYNPITSMPFFTILYNYTTRMRNATDNVDKARMFIFCYSNIKYISTNIDDLYDSLTTLEPYYYEPSYFMKKYNAILAESFISIFNTLSIRALTESELLTLYKNILSLNDPQLYIRIMEISQASIDDSSTTTTTTTESFVTREGMGSDVDRNAIKLFPLEPTYLNSMEGDYKDNSLKIIQDGYKYKDDNQNAYKTFSGYIENTISGGNVDFTNDIVFNCETVDGSTTNPTLKMDFYCGNIQQTTYEDVYDKDAFNKICSNNTNLNCDIESKIKIELRDNGNTSILILLFEESGISYEKVLFEPLPKLDSLETFGVVNEKKELITSTSNGTIELLTKINTSDTISQLGDIKCLMDDNEYIRLFINTQGTLSFQYKEKIMKPVTDSNLSSNIPIYAIKQPENNFSYSSLYNLNNEERNKVGQNLEKIHGYVGYDGIYHQADNVVGDAYENYSGYCFNDENANVTNEDNCNQQNDCIGLFADATNAYREVTHNNKQYLYPCKNNPINEGIYKHKKLHLNTDDVACIRNSGNAQIIDYDTYEKINKGSNFKPEDCGLNKLLKSNKTKFEDSRKDFTIKFENLLRTYNALSNNELEILKNTDIQVNELTNVLTEYKDLLQRSRNRSELLDSSIVQRKDSKKSNTQMEYKSAFFGIIALIGGIGCLHYMKNK